MKSKIASAIGILHEPVAILFSNDKPQNARQFLEGKWGCVMFMLGVAVNGDVAVFDRKTFGSLHIPYEYIVFKPLKLVDPALGKPEVILYFYKK